MVSSNYFDFVGHVINHDKSLSHCIAIKAAKHHAKIKLLDQILQFSEKMLQGEQLKISAFCKPRSKGNNHSRDSEITKQSSQENSHCPEALTIDSQFIRMGGQIDYVEYHCPVLQSICQLLQLLTDFLNGPFPIFQEFPGLYSFVKSFKKVGVDKWWSIVWRTIQKCDPVTEASVIF